MDWLQIFVQLILTGILLYVFQRVIDERSAKRLKEFETKFSTLHERQSNVVDNIYRKLINIYKIFDLLERTLKNTDSDTNKQELITISYHLIDDFKNYFDENKLFLPEKLGNSIYSFYKEALRVYSIFFLASLEEKEKIFENPQKLDNFMETSRVFVEKISFLIKEIEKEFRNLLGS